MTIQVLDGQGVLRTVANMDDFMTANPVGAQAITASRAVSPPTTSDSNKFKIVSTAGTNATLVSASARVLRALYVYNQPAYSVFFKLYDKATAPVLASDVPFWTIPIPAASGFVIPASSWGIPVTTGLGFAITKAFSNTDTTAIAVEDCVGMLLWR